MKGRNHKRVPGEPIPHVTTFGDRIRRAAKAFKGEKVGSLEFGVDIKRCDKCEYKEDHRKPMVFYLCDQKACDDDACSYPDCKYTLKIEHAKNFKPSMELGIYNGFNDYWEVEDEKDIQNYR